LAVALADDIVAVLHVVLDRVATSGGLPDAIKHRSRVLDVLADDTPELVRQGLRELANEYAKVLSFEPARTDLFRAITLDTFRRHVAADVWRAIDQVVFRRFVEAQVDPAGFLRSQVPPNRVVASAVNSWLIDCPALPSMAGAQIHLGLELLPEQVPPYVVFRFTPVRMAASGVEVRAPNALDAAAGLRPQWQPSGLSMGREWIDHDLPIEAVEEVLWIPA
jgi:hypothetical protein